MVLNRLSSLIKEKLCKSCGVILPRAFFHENIYSKSGLSSYCKECSSVKGKEYRQKRLEHYRAYDKARDKDERRKEYKKAVNEKYKNNNLEKIKARTALSKAIMKGLVIKDKSCKACGFESSKLHGHHYDYSKPLEVIWLCNDCHEVIHHG